MDKPDHEIVVDDSRPYRPGKPRTRWVFPSLVGALIVAGGALYYFWPQRPEPPSPPETESKPATQASAEPRIEHPIEAPTAPAAPLPTLAESDASMRDELSGMFGNSTFAQLFEPQDIVRRFVATIDNLPRKNVSQRLLPIKPASGTFRVSGAEGNIVISPDNAARYAPYVRAFETLDSAKLVATYVHFYPLFQQAYAELGYPSRYFNDRVFEVIDQLLATPDVSGPIALTQPKVVYEFADPELQSLSAGQKMLLRMGPENEAKVKAKLRELKRALSRGL